MRPLGMLLIFVAVALGVAGMLLIPRSVFYSSTAVVKVTRDKMDLPELSAVNGDAKTEAGDAFFIETEIAVIESDATLDLVITQLNLNEAWSGRLNRGQALETSQTSQLLKHRVEAQRGGGAGLIEITALSEVPEEAAAIANAVSQAYCEYRADYRRRLTQRALDTLTGEHTIAEQKIAASRRKMDQAWQQLDSGLQQLAATNASTETMMRALHDRFSDSLLRYLTASNQLALFPTTNPAHAEIIAELQSRADKAKAELTEAENATQSETRRAELLKSYQVARSEFEELTQLYARLRKTVEDLTKELRAQTQPPATIVEQATVPTAPAPRQANRHDWLLPAAGMALFLGIALLIVGRGPRRAVT